MRCKILQKKRMKQWGRRLFHRQKLFQGEKNKTAATCTAAEVCDARNDAGCSAAGNKKNIMTANKCNMYNRTGFIPANVPGIHKYYQIVKYSIFITKLCIFPAKRYFYL